MLFETRYFWAVFTSKDLGYVKKLRELFESTRTRYASSITIYEVYRVALANEGRQSPI